MTVFALYNSGNSLYYLGQMVVTGTPDVGSLGTFRFLANHYINDKFIQTGEIHEMFAPWVPTSDVEPLDATATANFYAQGPSLGSLVRTQFQPMFVDIVVTYWHQISPGYWALTGLGAGLSPVSVFELGRVK